jgi:type IV pilus assembly protein PilE
MRSHSPTSHVWRPRSLKTAGFSLIELVTVVAIVGILASVALPSYQRYVLKSHRADAMQALTEGQAILERCYAQSFSYVAACATAPATASPAGFYTIAWSNKTATSYTLTATATGNQAKDTTCNTMSIDQANQKVGKDNGGVAQTACWGS